VADWLRPGGLIRVTDMYYSGGMGAAQVSPVIIILGLDFPETVE
jgi:hypothetical protein